MTDLEARLSSVRARIEAACDRADRDPATVRLLPVSKTVSADVVASAHRAGLTRFAENRPQELRTKAEHLAGLGIEWVMIGQLQRNKAGIVADHANQLQSLDSLTLAGALQRRLDIAQRDLEVMVQVNTSGEHSKSGIAPDDAVDFASGLAQFPRLRPVGLMTVAAHSSDPKVVAGCFATLAAARQRIAEQTGQLWPDLSMGMSGDFELAIEQGSTCVRIGTALFGRRPAPQ